MLSWGPGRRQRKVKPGLRSHAEEKEQRKEDLGVGRPRISEPTPHPWPRQRLYVDRVVSVKACHSK